MDDCIFCKIVKGDIPCYKIYEDDGFLAFLDIAQITEGHTLVIPKEHHRFVWDVPNIGEYMEVAKKISDHFRKKMGYKFVDTITLGRMIPHAHIHLLPHNGGMNDWERSLAMFGDMQNDGNRRPPKEKFEKLVGRLSLI